MAEHELVTRLEQLEQELSRWDRAACLPLLGLLERLEVQLWDQLLHALRQLGSQSEAARDALFLGL